MMARPGVLGPWILLCSCTVEPTTVCVGSVSGLDCGEPNETPAPRAACGNGVLDAGERCDPGIVAGGLNVCPALCDDGDPCTSDELASAGTCAASCRTAPILACAGADGCCPAGCTSITDGDCTAACGDGVLDDGEGCDPGIPPGQTGACPAACDDGDACTVDELIGTGSCAASCTAAAILTCVHADGCCPAGCAFAADSDCPLPAEQCNGVDDDGDELIDEGCDDDADGWCDVALSLGSAPSCLLGGGDCDDEAATVFPGSVEICDGLDQNCDGQTDEGNPGGGASCEAEPVGECTAVMTCVGGTISCRGGFVSSLGAPGNPGTRAAPVSTIGAAIANATTSGSGMDVCVCASSPPDATIYAEPVTMVEGVSVIGDFNCDTWERNPFGPYTRIQNTRTDGVRFPAGLTRATVLDGFEVEPLVTAGGTSIALRITDSSPSLVDVEVSWPEGGPVPRSGIAVQIVASGGTAAPAITGGAMVGPGVATQGSIGVDCQGCAGTTLAVDRVRSGDAPVSIGIRARGRVDGLSILAGTSPFWDIDGLWGAVDAVGVLLDGCDGAPEIGAGTPLRIRGGFDPASGIGIRVTGPSCAPTIQGDGVGGSILGCSFELGAGVCIGISCENGAPCQILDNADIAGASFAFGVTSSTATTLAGVTCLDGGCAVLSRNRIWAGDPSATGSSVGIDVAGSSPIIDGNVVRGSDGLTCPAGACAAVRLDGSVSRLTNNVLEQGWASGAAVDVSGSLAPPQGPELHSNAIRPTCRSGGSGVGIRIVSGVASGPLPTLRNNIIAAQPSACSGIYGVQETGAAADPAGFTNNDIWGMTGGLYINEGLGALTTISQVNALVEASANLECDPVLDATGHIGGSSCCLDAGSVLGAPETDVDGQPRPLGTAFEIGPDEVAP